MYCQHRPSQSSSITVNVSEQRELRHVDFQVAENLGGVDHRRDRALLVPCPAAPDFAVGDFAFVRIVLPLARGRRRRPCRRGHRSRSASCLCPACRPALTDCPTRRSRSCRTRRSTSISWRIRCDDRPFLGRLGGDGDHVAQEADHRLFVLPGGVEDRDSCCS